MPTPATSKWPYPKHEDEWEDMALDALRIRWRDPDTRRNGRRGQRQHGVDIYGQPPGLDGYAGGQCKNVAAPTFAMVQAEVAEAEKFRPPLKKFYFVAAAPRDATDLPPVQWTV